MGLAWIWQAQQWVGLCNLCMQLVCRRTLSLGWKSMSRRKDKTDASSSSKDGSGYDTVIKVLGCNAFAGLFYICRAISRLHV